MTIRRFEDGRIKLGEDGRARRGEGVIVATVTRSGLAAGTSTAVGVLEDVLGTAAGTSTALAGAIVEASGTAAGTSTASGVVPVPADTWNPADKAAAISLSGGNLIATRTAGSGYLSVRSVGSKTTGKYHFEGTADVAYSNFALGVATSAFVLTTYSGSSESIGYYPSGDVWMGGTIVGNAGSYTNGDIPEVELDLDASPRTISSRPNNAASWTTFNLAGNLLTAPLFISWTADFAGQQITLNTGDTAFNGTPRSGYVAWGPP